MNKLSLAVSAGLFVVAGTAQARDNIEVVGSSTVFPFSTVVAEAYAKKTGNPAPKVESTGSGGGMKLFCDGTGINTPDITNSSRRIKSSELEKCAANGVSPVEVKVGYDGIAFANSKKGDVFKLTRKDIFMALAKDVPVKEGDQDKLVPNPYKMWNEVNADLPAIKIEVLGPPPTSGTRDAFAELALEGGCKKIDWVNALKKSDSAKYKEICHTVREDGHYIEAGENDNLIVQKLEANPNALGIFGFSFLDQNADKVQGSEIDGVAISFDNIAAGDYPVSRPLYFYVKKEHIGTVKGIEEFVAEFTNEATWGEDGYLADKGMIPMPEEERKLFGDAVKNMTVLKSM
ncbi:MAG: Phosphate ABC transporter, periplasmic phosphate-binding protein PstS (TC 3.A.1.7.1) [uncultured Thiotrichaceae bacterium]|uniref:Phosphate ABC transporter, periplasmic phosphate-binding protein PstS (TC 3.A.1.7.1) n=1 Tax=uncultured Thiotrichaceae bacterium TaxID=298394 RepID=A0A6S6T5H5_9GAMM|nr:MAG: Phosphate ABC transporter, periplasmic phosphate-binding protein PstS (TC 3.A.1.7.1) [uncultured Thiotrichaceae bacterium]